MPERRNRLRLTQGALDKPMLTGPVLSLDLKARIADIFLWSTPCFLFNVCPQAARMPISDKLFNILINNFRATGTNGCLDLSLSLLTF